MITLLLTLHTATTATLLVVTLPLNNTHAQKKNLYNQFATQSQQTVCLNLIWNAGTASFHNLVRIVMLLNRRWIPKSWEEQSEEALKFQTMLFLQLMCYWQSNLMFSALRGVRCFSPPRLCLNLVCRLLRFLGVGRANWAPRCLLWICAFVLLIPVHSKFDVP